MDEEYGTLLLMIDGFDPRIGREAGCKHIWQTEWGVTNLAAYNNMDFLHSIVLWYELVTGKMAGKELIGNMYEFKIRIPHIKPMKVRVPPKLGDTMQNKFWREDRIGKSLAKLSPLRKIVDQKIWEERISVDETIARHFKHYPTQSSDPMSFEDKNYKLIDVPLTTHNFEDHKRIRYEQGRFANDVYDENLLSDFESVAWERYSKSEEELLDSICKDYRFIGFFTSILDIHGHQLIWKPDSMKRAYRKVDDLIGKIEDYGIFKLLASDHGFNQVSKYYGAHSNEGFWSCSERLGLDRPTLGELSRLVVDRAYLPYSNFPYIFEV